MDYRIEHWINAPAGAHPVLDAVMVRAAGWAEAVFLAVIVVWFLLGWVRGLERERRGAITALVGAAAALLINVIVSHIWYRPRPFASHPNAVHLLIPHPADASFPSDHASAAFAISFVLLVFHRRLGVLALLYAALMSYARVYVGEHYPSDVAAGLVVGVVVAAVLVFWLEPAMRALSRLADRVILTLHLPLPRRGHRTSLR